MNNKYNWFFIPFAVISIIIMMLQKAGPFEGRLTYVGFALFTILCIALTIENRKSKGKRVGAVLFFLFGLFVLFN